MSGQSHPSVRGLSHPSVRAPSHPSVKGQSCPSVRGQLHVGSAQRPVRGRQSQTALQLSARHAQAGVPEE